jgi:hypothetical protein
MFFVPPSDCPMSVHARRLAGTVLNATLILVVEQGLIPI